MSDTQAKQTIRTHHRAVRAMERSLGIREWDWFTLSRVSPSWFRTLSRLAEDAHDARGWLA